MTTFQTWDDVGRWYAALERERTTPDATVRAKSDELTKGRVTELEKIDALYDFVSTKFRYVNLSFGLGRYQPHAAGEILANAYGDSKDKHTLLEALLDAQGIRAYPALVPSDAKARSGHSVARAIRPCDHRRPSRSGHQGLALA